MYLANDGRVLMQLDAHLRSLYPVDPKYAEGTFHFHEDLTDDLEVLMKTYANASFGGKKMHEKLGLNTSSNSKLTRISFLKILFQHQHTNHCHIMTLYVDCPLPAVQLFEPCSPLRFTLL